MKSNYLKKVEHFIYEFYKDNAPPENVYHNYAHAEDVVSLVKEIGKNSGIENEELEILAIAAWFHDVGYTECKDGHEERSAESAEEYLLGLDYDKDKIEKVKKCIKATKIPHDPADLLEEIICDADISHIGTKEFFDHSELLKLEIENRNNQKISDFEWMEKNIEFLTKIKFFTKYAKERFDHLKNANLLKLRKRYNKKLEKKNDKLAKDEKLAVEKEKLAKKEAASKKSDRGIETMFRNVIRTHVSFSSMADSKANIMISVNTLLLAAIFTILAGKLDANPHLIIPTFVLTAVSLVTLILSIRVTRPVISSGMFTKEDIRKKKANLLFFGYFYKMSLDDFTWGMNEMMEDKDYLYGSMIKDFYYLGQVLGKKYNLLRLSYTVFMYGIIVSAILYAIFVVLNPNTTEITTLIE